MLDIIATIIACVIGGFVGYALADLLLKRRRYKYKWKCPICQHFVAEASSQDIIERVKTVHTHEETDELRT